MIIGSVEMTVSLPNGKIESISKCCQKLLQMEGVTVRELSSFLGILNSTVLNISSSSFIHKVSLQKAVRRPLCNKKFRQQTVFGPYIKGETKLVARKFTLEKWEINSNSEISNSAI